MNTVISKKKIINWPVSLAYKTGVRFFGSRFGDSIRQSITCRFPFLQNAYESGSMAPSRACDTPGCRHSVLRFTASFYTTFRVDSSHYEHSRHLLGAWN